MFYPSSEAYHYLFSTGALTSVVSVMLALTVCLARVQTGLLMLSLLLHLILAGTPHKYTQSSLITL